MSRHNIFLHQGVAGVFLEIIDADSAYIKVRWLLEERITKWRGSFVIFPHNRGSLVGSFPRGRVSHISSDEIASHGKGDSVIFPFTDPSSWALVRAML